MNELREKGEYEGRGERRGTGESVLHGQTNMIKDRDGYPYKEHTKHTVYKENWLTHLFL